MKRWLFDLQRFGDGAGDSGNADQGGSDNGNQNGPNNANDEGKSPSNSSNDGGQQSDKGDSKGKSEPFAVFPDEQSFTSRVQREANKQYKEFLKSLGFEKEDDIKAIVKAKKDADEKAKTDLEKAQEKAQNAEKERDSALQQANKVLIQTDAKVQAMALGVKPERVDYLLRLADLNEVEVKDGKVDTSAVKDALHAVLKDLPELKQEKGSKKGGNDFSGGDSNKDLLTMEAIKSMSTEEAAERMDEIMDFMKKNKKKK